ncbi:hypothetical protein ACT9XH_07045 [Methanococcoides methylutens]|uniref:hypothetical protein n=1 Tax=Methanococcoides methylutens TaxID=2226 RepID=UPI0040446F0A
MNILHFFDMGLIHKEWAGPVDLFDPRCVDLLMGHIVLEIEIPDEKGIIHMYDNRVA